MTDHETVPETISRRRAFRPFLIAGIGVIFVFLAVAVGSGVYTSMRFRQLVDLGKETQADYAKLEEAYPFDPAAVTQSAVPAARWHDMLEVRRRALATLSPMAQAQLAGLLELGSLTEVDPAFVLRLLPLGGQLRVVVDEHLAALNEHAMSGEEYRWLLSHAVHQVMEETRSQPPEASSYWRVLHVAERLSHTDDDDRNDITALEVADLIVYVYGPMGDVDPLAVAALRTTEPAVAMLDLLAIASGWIETDAMTSEQHPAG